MFDVQDFSHLRFLEGQWRGTNSDGSFFFERYDFPDSVTIRSQRFADGTFKTSTDGSTVSLRDGAVISQWGEFTWRATAISAVLATFAPVKAPSSFSWRRIDADHVEVTQQWKDENGRDRSSLVPLRRLGQ